MRSPLNSTVEAVGLDVNSSKAHRRSRPWAFSLPLFVFLLLDSGHIKKIVLGEQVGTLIRSLNA